MAKKSVLILMATSVQITGADMTPGIYSLWDGATTVVILYNHQVKRHFSSTSATGRFLKSKAKMLLNNLLFTKVEVNSGGDLPSHEINTPR